MVYGLLPKTKPNTHIQHHIKPSSLTLCNQRHLRLGINFSSHSGSKTTQARCKLHQWFCVWAQGIRHSLSIDLDGTQKEIFILCANITTDCISNIWNHYGYLRLQTDSCHWQHQWTVQRFPQLLLTELPLCWHPNEEYKSLEDAPLSLGFWGAPEKIKTIVLNPLQKSILPLHQFRLCST